MAEIRVLDSATIDKIAAGEVVERPASVVKELVENAIDAGANTITVEAKGGGIEFLRVTDNGSGMEESQVRTAFCRHATSKISCAEDLTQVISLGFRGEALSSIAAVSKVELITKTKGSLTGTRLVLEGGVETEFAQVGAPEGTTFIMRNLFYNTPVRRKFLKTPATEGGYILELMEHLALSRPDISFKLILDNREKIRTMGNGELMGVLYNLYGRETVQNVVPIRYEENGVRVDGYLGKSGFVRSNRNYEMFYINGRFIKSPALSRAVEEGYKEYLMQHKFPFCVLNIHMPAEWVDVNVHPTKMEVRFSDAMGLYQDLSLAVYEALHRREMIPQATLPEVSVQEAPKAEVPKLQVPTQGEPKRNESIMEATRTEEAHKTEMSSPQVPTQEAPKPNVPEPEKSGPEVVPIADSIPPRPARSPELFETKRAQSYKVMEEARYEAEVPEVVRRQESYLQAEKPQQLNLFEEKILTWENRQRYRLIGQVFDTYWILQFEDQMMIMDQHAAHEKVKYERLIKQYREKQVLSQRLLPPIVVSLSGREESVLQSHLEIFTQMGFEVEEFGGKEYTLRSVPVDLYGCDERTMFLELLDQLAGESTGDLRVVEEKIASMSCKAAVKGNHTMSAVEAQELIDELLTLENPYNCPHGRPTLIKISKAEMEKRFKRIV